MMLITLWLTQHTAQGKQVFVSGPDKQFSAGPYIAYVQVGKLAASDQQTVYCALFDYRRKSMVHRQKVVVSQNSFATDFPGLFTPPEVAKKNGRTHFAFGFADGSNIRTICNLRAP
jgi:hypothetical protein